MDAKLQDVLNRWTESSKTLSDWSAWGSEARDSRIVVVDPAEGLRRQLRFSTAMFFASTLYPSARAWLATAISIRFMIDVLLEMQNDDYLSAKEG